MFGIKVGVGCFHALWLVPNSNHTFPMRGLIPRCMMPGVFMRGGELWRWDCGGFYAAL